MECTRKKEPMKAYELVSAEGKVLRAFNACEAGRIGDGLIKYRIEDKWGIMNSRGETVAEPAFSEAYGEEKEGLIRVKSGGKWGYIGTDGATVVEPRFEDCAVAKIKGFFNGLKVEKLGGKYGYIDRTGRFVIEPKFDWAERFKDGFARVAIDGKWKLIDKEGKFVSEKCGPEWDDSIRKKYRWISHISDGVYLCEADESLGENGT